MTVQRIIEWRWSDEAIWREATPAIRNAIKLTDPRDTDADLVAFLKHWFRHSYRMKNADGTERVQIVYRVEYRDMRHTPEPKPSLDDGYDYSKAPDRGTPHGRYDGK